MSSPPTQPRYVHLRLRLPASAWPALRLLVLAAVGGIVALLLADPEVGLPVFWGLVVPAIPLIFMLAPGLWRNLCPMATANQLPRVLGITRARPLPRWLERHGYAIGVVAFFGLVMARPLLFEHSGAAAALLIGAVLLTPFLTGLVFKGKSGFCGSICPLRAAQGLYGRAPAVRVTHSHCRPCVGCTSNCQDLKPTTMHLDDLRDRDRVVAGYRRLFAGTLPGFTYAFFTLPANAPAGDAALRVGVAMLVGLGALSIVQALLGAPGRVTALAGAVSLGLFYWFNVAVVAATVGQLTGTAPQAWAIWEGRAVVALLVGGWLVRSWREARKREGASAPPVEAPMAPPLPAAAPAPAPAGMALPMVMQTPGAPAVPTVVAGEPPVPIPDRRSPDRPLRQPRLTLWPEGHQVDVEPGSSLIAALALAGVETPKGCGTGLCGADPVYVLTGGEGLSAPGSDEQATLQRMSLAPHARLACSVRVLGDVTVTQSADALPFDAEPAPARPGTRTPVTARSAGRVVVLGNGVAGVTAAAALRRLDAECQIDLVTDSPHPFYNRIAISRLIHQPAGLQGLQLMPDRWYDEQRITQWLNTRAARIERDAEQVVLGTGEILPYDRLVLATGAVAAVPPIPGVHLPGVFTVRRAEDALRIRAHAQEQGCRRAVVIGGGLLGLEAADALGRLGLEPTVVEGGAWLGHRELDQRSGELLRQHLRGHGIEARVGTAVGGLRGEERADGVELVGGEVIDTDLVLVCAGIRPNVSLAREAGLAIARGVVVDAHMRTTDPRVLACGDVTEYEGELSGRWATAIAQAEVAAVTALGGQRTYEPAPIATKLALRDLDLLSIGLSHGGPDDEELVDEGPGPSYRKLVLSKGRVTGAIAFGATADHELLADAVRGAVDVRHAVDELRAGDWSPLGLTTSKPAPKPKRRSAA